jgi:hypothetical protein
VDDLNVVERETDEVMMKVDSDAEVAVRQRLKEAAGNPDDSREREAVGKGDLEGEGQVAETELGHQQAESKRPSYEKYLEWKRRKEEEEERQRNPEKITDPYAFEARMFRQRSMGQVLFEQLR